MILKKIAEWNKRRKTQKHRLRDKNIISGSNLFDPKWYTNEYPEIENYKFTPLDHYVEFGAFEGRAAGPLFNTLAYVIANPDVREAEHNPLVHYICHGEKEGRNFFSGSTNSLKYLETAVIYPLTFSVVVGQGINEGINLTFKSLKAQTGCFIEIIYDEKLENFFSQQTKRDNKNSFIKYIPISVSSSQNFIHTASLIASYEFLIYLNAGELIDAAAFHKISKLIRRKNCDLVYSDESQAVSSSIVKEKFLKPSWSPELLLAYDYFGHLTAIRTSIVQDILTRSNDILQLISNAAAEWDIHLRVAQEAHHIERLPEILCHRIKIGNQDLRLPTLPSMDYDLVLKAFWKRRGYNADISLSLDGTLRSTWPLFNPPLVSIIISNNDHASSLRICIDGLLNKTSYKNIEVIVVDNGSVELETFEFYRSLPERGVRIVSNSEKLSYPRAYNLGVIAANGEFLLFLNNNVEIVQDDWLEHLVRTACEPGVGVVVAKLLYSNGEIRHAGVTEELFKIVPNVSHHMSKDWHGAFGSPNIQSNWSTASGACHLVRRTLFDLVFGYDEGFFCSYGDLMLCLDVAQMGFRTVYLPSSVLICNGYPSYDIALNHEDQILFTKRLRSQGISVDRYFNNRLDAKDFDPKTVLAEAAVNSAHMRGAIETIAGPPAQPVDPTDFGAVATAAGVSWDAVVWAFDPLHMKPSIESGARIVLQFIWRRPDLRKRFPMPIRDGAQGGFARWIKTDGLRLLGLNASYAQCIDAAFASDIGGKSRQILMHDQAFRNDNPLYLLPEGRNASCARLFSACVDGLITREDIWWFLFATAESPQAALCEMWASTPSWQEAIPDGGTVFGIIPLTQWVWDQYGVRDQGVFAQDYPSTMSDSAQVRIAYAARPEWQKRFPTAMTEELGARALLDHLATRASGLPFLARGWVEARRSGTLTNDIVRHGINVLGHFAYPSGLRISAESLVEGLIESGITVSPRDVPVSEATDDPTGHRFQGLEIYDTTLIHVQPEPLFDDVYNIAGLFPRKEKTYRIGYWYWEFDEVPASWNRASLQCDEIWTATQFIADGLRRHYRQPIHVLTPGIEMPAFDRMPRARFKIPEDEFVFTFVFHMTSVMDRKNPLGLIKAFKLAFNVNDRARLIIKTTFGGGYPNHMKVMREAASGYRIDIIDEVFTRADTLSLIDCSDAYASLHRSEGLGLTMAEAMLLGKPVVATRYSGNLEFMDDDNSFLVDHYLIKLDRDINPYKAGLQWAEPSTKHAAVLMRKLYEQPDVARAVGAQAKDDLEQRLSYLTTGRAVAQRLAEIRGMGSPAPMDWS